MGNRERLFDGWAEGYDASIDSGDTYPFAGYDEVLDRIAEIAGLPAAGRVLDVGIGTGNLASRFAPIECAIWGVDFSERMLAKAAEKLPDAKLVKANLVDGWSDRLPERFDRIVSAYVLHEFPDEVKVRVLADLSRHLHEKGRIVIGDIAFPDEAARVACREAWLPVWDDEEFYWAAASIRPALEAVGLSVTYHQVSFCGGVFDISPAEER